MERSGVTRDVLSFDCNGPLSLAKAGTSFDLVGKQRCATSRHCCIGQYLNTILPQAIDSPLDPAGVRVNKPKIYGAAFSVHVQAVRLALAEKGVAHDLIEVDPFQPGGPGETYLVRHPFGLIPAFERRDVRLYEAEAIARYVDEAYPGRPLMPLQARSRARANQLLSILRCYAYPTWVRTLYIEGVAKPRRGESSSKSAVERALPTARTALSEAAGINAETGGAFLFGATTTLPDLFCAPMLACLVDAPEGNLLLDEQPTMRDWWNHMSRQQNVQALVI